MTLDNDYSPEATRLPTLEDLLLICRHLNQEEARYILIGGFAIFEHGLARLTEDIDLLVEDSPGNIVRVKRGLSCLPDQAVRDVLDSDIADYTVVRVNDVITVDLMGSACGIRFGEAEQEIVWREIQGVHIPVASPSLLWKTKQTHREKDALDRSFLKKWFADHNQTPPEV